LLLYAPRFHPSLLVFPHHASAGIFEVWSETPIDQAKLQAIADNAERRLRDSPLYVPPEQRNVYLTQGGWRWQWLALSTSDAFAISPPVSNAVIVNRNSVDQNAVWNGRTVGGRRTLAGILTHETCHGMERRRFGLHSDWTTPKWLNEGYCDHVAQESSLSDADYAALMAGGISHPALPYYIGRKRVAAALAANGGNVDSLFANAD
jgi:hypothetical protein